MGYFDAAKENHKVKHINPKIVLFLLCCPKWIYSSPRKVHLKVISSWIDFTCQWRFKDIESQKGKVGDHSRWLGSKWGMGMWIVYWEKKKTKHSSWSTPFLQRYRLMMLLHWNRKWQKKLASSLRRCMLLFFLFSIVNFFQNPCLFCAWSSSW